VGVELRAATGLGARVEIGVPTARQQVRNNALLFTAGIAIPDISLNTLHFFHNTAYSEYG
jgi:hypothetical protein